MLRAILYISIFIMPLFLQAQEQAYVPDDKAKKAFQQGLSLWKQFDAEKAEKQILKAISLDSNYVDPYILMGEMAIDQHDGNKAIYYFEKAISKDSTYSPALYYMLGNIYSSRGEFDRSAEYLGLCLALPNLGEGQKARTEDLYEKVLFRKHAIENPIPFEPENLGVHVNSENDEFVNSITLDEKNMVFTLMEPSTSIKGHFTEGFVMAVKGDSGWVLEGRALPDLYALGNIGAMSLSPDGKFLFFTSCGAPGGYGSCDLYACGKIGDDWSKPQNLGGVVNLESWDSQPCFSADGQTLYFSSARPGGMGGSDIWSTTFIPDKGWTKPKNLGKNINTDQEEMAPYIHPDGRSMYFSSKGHLGMGGFDLFLSRLDSNGLWMSPQNIGYPVNTEADEINIVVSTNGKAAYLSSDLEEGYGGYDIYRFDLPQKMAPHKVSYLEGIIYDAETLLPIEAELELIGLVNDELAVRCKSDPGTGYYMAALPGGKNYALNISREGYLFHSENFNLEITEVAEDAIQKDVFLKPIKSGESIVLDNIFFDTDEYTLKEISLTELYKLNAFLVRNPDIEIMICGHTDDIGTAEYNQSLSEKRAAAVFSFLVENGINPSRLKYKGFGLSEPLDTNDSEEGRAKNRRTEILVL